MVKTNIKTELTAEQAGLVITAIRAEIGKGTGTFLSESDVLNLGRVAHNLQIHLNFGV